MQPNVSAAARRAASQLVRETAVDEHRFAEGRTAADLGGGLEDLMAYLASRGVAQAAPATWQLFCRVIFTGPDARTVSRLSANLYTSRRWLSRWAKGAGLPTPVRLLGFARCVRAACIMWSDGSTAGAAAHAAGFPDPFSFSNVLRRYTGLRCSDLYALGPVALAEAWIRTEGVRLGGPDRAPRPALCPTCGHHVDAAPLDAEERTRVRAERRRGNHPAILPEAWPA